MTLRIRPEQLVEESRSALTAIADGWARVPLRRVASVQNGFAFPSTRFTRDAGIPLIRIRDVGSDTADTRFDGQFDVDYVVRHGDIIVGMDGDFRTARWRGEDALLNQRVCRIRVLDAKCYDEQFLLHALPGYLDVINAATSSVTVKHLSSETLKDLPLPLPPLAEQHRIVEAIDAAFSKLDAGVGYLVAARKRLSRFRESALRRRFSDPRWPIVHLEEAAEVRLGRQRSPDKASGPRMRPYLRAANVGWGGLKLDDVKEMAFTESESETFELRDGDLVLSEASGSPGEVGKPAIWHNEIRDCCFQNTLLRVRAADVVEPKFLLYFFRHEAHIGSFARSARGVGIHHLGSAALTKWPVPLPPKEEQRHVIEAVERLHSCISSVESEIDAQLRKASMFRRAVLATAFSGQFVRQSASDEPSFKLLDRITAIRVESGSPSARTNQRRTRTPGATP